MSLCGLDGFAFLLDSKGITTKITKVTKNTKKDKRKKCKGDKK